MAPCTTGNKRKLVLIIFVKRTMRMKVWHSTDDVVTSLSVIASNFLNYFSRSALRRNVEFGFSIHIGGGIHEVGVVRLTIQQRTFGVGNEKQNKNMKNRKGERSTMITFKMKREETKLNITMGEVTWNNQSLNRLSDLSNYCWMTLVISY